MARGSEAAQGAATSAQGLSNTAEGNAQGLYSTLAPTLMQQATHPQGMTPTAIAGMTTAATQTGGGTQSGAVGQGALSAARTRNIGAGDAATAQSARTAGEQVSKGVLGTQLANEQQKGALKGMEGLYSSNLGAGVNALGQVASNVQADVAAQNASWDWAKDVMDPLMQDAATVYAAKLSKK